MENDGIKREFYENGRISSETPILSGWYKSFNRNGLLDWKFYIKNGEANGFDFKYNSFGKIDIINKWKNSSTRSGPQIKFKYV